MKKLLFTIALLICIAQFANSQLVVKNGYPVPVSFCYGWYQQTDSWSGFKSKGWHKIEPQSTITIPIPFEGSAGSVFYYFETNKEVDMKGGAMSLLVHPTNAFEIKNANLEYTKEQNTEYIWKSFKRVDVSFKLLQKRRYELNLEIL